MGEIEAGQKAWLSKQRAASEERTAVAKWQERLRVLAVAESVGIKPRDGLTIRLALDTWLGHNRSDEP
jgi:hypothetical protein